LPERHRILIIDDNALDRQAVVHALSREVIEHDGIEADVQEAETIAQAREALRREEFTCIFLDASLPDGAPTDLLMEVRSQGLSTPVIVLTGQRDEQAILEVMKAGAIDYLPKDRLQPELVAQSLRAALRFQEAQREKQAALSELRARDRAIAAATNGIAISDPRQHDCPLVYVNEAFLRMTGYTEAEVLGRNCRFLQGSGTDRNTVRELHEALQEARPCQVLLYNYRKDGVGFWNELTVSPVQDAQGTLTHFVGIQTDVTVRHEEEQERIRTSDTLRQFQFLSDNSNDAFFLIDNSGHFVYVNDAACRSLGHSAEEFAQMRPFDIDPNYDDAAYQALFQLTGGQRLAPFESQQRRKDGTVFPIEASVSRVDIGGRSLLFSSCRDITARKAVEQALQKASERTTGILESITDAFFALDVEFRFTYVNSQAEHLLLRTREELLGQHLLDAFPEASGSTFDFQYQRAFTEQIAVSFEEFFPPLDTWFEVRAYPSESGLSIFFQDVNERRQAQEALRISEQALRESNRQARDAQLRLESALSLGRGI
jgi:PAS domain S-box-containing protein